MKLKYIIIPLTMLALSSCESTNKNEIEDTTQKTTIKGSSMLSSGASEQSKATICLDINSNGICEDDEPKTNTDKEGKFELKVDFKVKEGTHLIAKDGFSLVRQETNTDKLTYVKYYSSSEKEQHINAFSTYIVNELSDNPSLSYKDAIANFLNKRDIDIDVVNYEPIYAKKHLNESGNKFFDTTFAIDKLMYEKAKEKAKNADVNVSFRGVSSTNPSDGEIDQTIEDNKDYLDSFLDMLKEYFEDLSKYLSDWYDSIFSEDVNGSTDIVDIEITRDTFNGIWLLKNYNDAQTKTCTVIDSADNVVVYEKDGAVTELTLEYNDTDKSLILSKGFITAETIYFTEYKSDGSFKAHYSDGVKVDGFVQDSLDICKSKL